MAGGLTRLRVGVAAMLLAGCAVGQGGGNPSGPDAAPAADARPLVDARPPADAPPPPPDATPPPPDAIPPPDGTPPATEQSIFACSYAALYRFEPATALLLSIGPFDWPATTGDTMFDLAIDRDGVLVGVSQTTLYQVDPVTAEATTIATLSITGILNGLTFVAAADLGGTGPDRLLGTATDGRYYEIDRASGVMTQLGELGTTGAVSSGDVVSLEGLGTWATVLPQGATTDSLLPLQPGQGNAGPPVGTGLGGLWGLAWWSGDLYGFGSLGQIVRIDPVTAVPTTVLEPAQTGVTLGFYGATIRPTAGP